MARDSAIREELLRLAKRDGGELKPEAVVRAARPESSPLHASFDWDDSEAAQRWRLHQARQLIRVVVTYEPGKDGDDVPQRVFVSLTPDRKGEGVGYRLMVDVMADVEARAQLLADARSDMYLFRTKYRRLTELAEVFDAMERVEIGTAPIINTPAEQPSLSI
jgi:hypothetical protein